MKHSLRIHHSTSRRGISMPIKHTEKMEGGHSKMHRVHTSTYIFHVIKSKLTSPFFFPFFLAASHPYLRRGVVNPPSFTIKFDELAFPDISASAYYYYYHNWTLGTPFSSIRRRTITITRFLFRTTLNIRRLLFTIR